MGRGTDGPILKTEAQLEKMRAAGRIVAGALRAMSHAVRAGVPTVVLDRVGEDYVRACGATASFKGYRPRGAETPFPAAVCISVDDVVVHGVPSETVVLQPGDIVGLDIGVCVGGCHADGATTVTVGEVSPRIAELVEVTRAALDAAVEAAQCGGRLRDIATAIHRTVEGSLSECKTGIRVIRDLAGHGVGCEVHEPPSIPNYAPDCDGRLRLAEGMTLAIEPMTSLGAATTKRCPVDRWGARTADGAWSAHFEHTVHIRRGTPEILTTCEE